MNKTANVAIETLNDRLNVQIANMETQQQAVVRSFQELKNLLDFAQISGNNDVAKKTMAIIEHHLQTINGLSPQLGAAFRDFVFKQ